MKSLTAKEVAKRWHLSERTVGQWRYQGRGPRFVKLEGRVVYRESDIEAFEAERERFNTTTTRRSEGQITKQSASKLLEAATRLRKRIEEYNAKMELEERGHYGLGDDQAPTKASMGRKPMS